MNVEVTAVERFAAPQANGTWPCGFCGRSFAVADSWHVWLRRTPAVVCCRQCAQDADRTGRAVLDDGSGWEN